MAEFAEGLGFDLPDALSGHVELPAHLLEGAGFTVVEAVPKPQHPGFPGREARQDLHKTIGVEGSSIYLEEGEKLSVRHLLYGLMLRSGNDCAETLAVHCSGSIDNFAELMNKTAKKIGAINGNFVNPHGLHNDNHYTTAYDLALISCYAMKNNDFREIVSTKSIKIPFTTRGMAGSG